MSKVNVKDAPYNAVGNGIADDTNAIQSALYAAGAGGVVYIPQGTYRLSSALRVSTPISLIYGDGEGTLLYQTGEASAILYNPSRASGYQYLTIRDLKIYGKGVTDEAACIKFYSGGDCHIENIIFRGGKYGLVFSGSLGNTVIGCKADRGYSSIVTSKQEANVLLQPYPANAGSGSGTHSNANSFFGCSFSGDHNKSNWALKSYGSSFHFFGGRQEGHAVGGFYVSGCEGFIIDGFHVEGIAGPYGVHVVGSRLGTINGGYTDKEIRVQSSVACSVTRNQVNSIDTRGSAYSKIEQNLMSTDDMLYYDTDASVWGNYPASSRLAIPQGQSPSGNTLYRMSDLWASNAPAGLIPLGATISKDSTYKRNHTYGAKIVAGTASGPSGMYFSSAGIAKACQENRTGFVSLSAMVYCTGSAQPAFVMLVRTGGSMAYYVPQPLSVYLNQGQRISATFKLPTGYTDAWFLVGYYAKPLGSTMYVGDLVINEGAMSAPNLM